MNNCRVSLHEIEAGQNCFSINAQICSFCNLNKRPKKEDSKRRLPKKLKADLAYKLNPVFFKLPEAVDTCNNLKENAQIIKNLKQKIFTIASFIKDLFPLEQKSECVICKWIYKQSQQHTLSNCPEMRDRCLRCLTKGHQIESCKITIKFNGVHNECGLPYDNLGRIVFHLGENCQTSASAQLIPLLMFVFHTERRFLEAKADKEFTGAEEFFGWINERHLGITNGMNLFVELLK